MVEYVQGEERGEAWLKKACDPWVVGTADFREAGHQDAWLGDGLVGQRVGRGGPVEGLAAAEACMIHGLWGEDALLHPPRWCGLRLRVGGQEYSLSAGEHEGFSQQLDLRKAELTNLDRWHVGGRTMQLRTVVFLARSRPGVGLIEVELRADGLMEVTLEDELDAEGTASNGPWTWEVREGEIVAGAAEMGLTRHKLAMAGGVFFLGGQEWDQRRVEVAIERGRAVRQVTWRAQAGRTYRVGKAVALVCPAAWREKEGETRQLSAQAAQRVRAAGEEWEQVRREHERAWAELWQSRVEIEGLPRLQQLVNAALYQLYGMLRPGVAWSVGPTGISGPSWGGRVFWDADLWVFPGLALLQPELAKSIVEYRWHTLEGAKRNAVKDGYAGALFAWESAETGEEKIPAQHYPVHEQRHVNSDVALAQYQYVLISGDETYLKERALPVILEAARFWASRVKFNAEKERYELPRMFCADEFAGIRDNNAFTNYSAVVTLGNAIKLCRKLGLEYPALWQDIMARMYYPWDQENQRYIEFDGYKGQTIKQADTVLMIYPYQMPMSDAVKANVVDYYRTKYPPGHIMMASAIDGIVDCELGRTERAWEAMLDLLPHFRGPFWLVSEQPTNSCISFVTGLGGFLQLLIHGFGGVRVGEEGLAARPCLPGGIKSLRIHGIHFGGKRMELEIQRDTAGQARVEVHG
ncbi:MAG: glycoside hydrolase family 65 protein [Phycisphaeraceae bacterium]|nr:glycoside hydrolase family 65 protein [Phycisphaeraceae bacterium]